MPRTTRRLTLAIAAIAWLLLPSLARADSFKVVATSLNGKPPEGDVTLDVFAMEGNRAPNDVRAFMRSPQLATVGFGTRDLLIKELKPDTGGVFEFEVKKTDLNKLINNATIVLVFRNSTGGRGGSVTSAIPYIVVRGDDNKDVQSFRVAVPEPPAVEPCCCSSCTYTYPSCSPSAIVYPVRRHRSILRCR